MFENSDLTGRKMDEIWGFHRLLNLTETTQAPFQPVIPTHQSIVTPDEAPLTSPTLSVGNSPSSFSDVNVSPPVDRKNLVGLLLVVGILILTVVIIRPKKSK
jgi:hypothetical protein